MGRVFLFAALAACAACSSPESSNAPASEEALARGDTPTRATVEGDAFGAHTLVLRAAGQTFRYAHTHFEAKIAIPDFEGDNSRKVPVSARGINISAAAINPKTGVVGVAVTMASYHDTLYDLVFEIDPNASVRDMPAVRAIHGQAHDRSLNLPEPFLDIASIGYGKRQGTLNVVTSDARGCTHFFQMTAGGMKKAGETCEN